MAGFMACYTMFSVETRPATVRRIWPRALVDLAIVCLAGLIVGIVLRGGGQVDVFGIRVSFTRLYTPVLLLTLMIGDSRVDDDPAARRRGAAADGSRADGRRRARRLRRDSLAGAVGYRVDIRRNVNWISPQIWWRNSAPGVDLLAYLAPNPLHPWFGAASFDWLTTLPGGFNENVASLPWVALATILGAVIWAGFRPLKGWVVFTGVFAWLALGPFVAIGQQLTYVPTPWALLRYLPVVGAARTPTRMTIVVMLGVSMLLVMALQHLRSRARHPRLLVTAVAALLMFELLPAPRTLYSAEIPEVYRMVAADPRPIRVLSLPFGLRDGLSSRGNYSSSSQFYQTFHEKRLVGGYISRLPNGSVERYRRNTTLKVLLRLSEGTPVEPELYERALNQADRTLQRLQIGYIVVDRHRSSPELIDFAQRAFKMTLVLDEGSLELYRTPVAPPLQP